MDETGRFGLPLVQSAQSQKHVTVNEALARIDAVVQMQLVSRVLMSPPAVPVEGNCYAVAAGAVDAWAGQDGRVAAFLNGGWVFLTPGEGWRAWIADEGTGALFDGVDWVPGEGTVSSNGAALAHRVIEFDHVIGAGPTSVTLDAIPSHALVYGVTARVLEAVTGSLSSWQLGIGGDSADRYGTGYGLGTGAWARGVTSSPTAYYVDTPLTLTGEGGSFAGGTVRFAVHVAELTVPRA